MRCRSLDEAIAIGNGVEYGLSASIYTQDINRAFAGDARPVHRHLLRQRARPSARKCTCRSAARRTPATATAKPAWPRSTCSRSGSRSTSTSAASCSARRSTSSRSDGGGWSGSRGLGKARPPTSDPASVHAKVLHPHSLGPLCDTWFLRSCTSVFTWEPPRSWAGTRLPGRWSPTPCCSCWPRASARSSLRRRRDWEGTQRLFWDAFAAGIAMWCIGQVGFTISSLTGEQDVGAVAHDVQPVRRHRSCRRARWPVRIAARARMPCGPSASISSATRC